jgi:myo-inositol-1(or 4)-monophosphatase
VLSEEGVSKESRTGLTWVVDPLDGTTNFMHAFPSWSVSIACVDATGEVVGVVYDPLRKETFVAVRSSGAQMISARDRKTPLMVTEPVLLREALVCTGFAAESKLRKRQADLFVRVLDNVQDVRCDGGCALHLSWLAAGRVDAVYEDWVWRWDWAAGALAAREAGAHVSVIPRRDGRALVFAGGPTVHAAIEEMLRPTMAER